MFIWHCWRDDASGGVLCILVTVLEPIYKSGKGITNLNLKKNGTKNAEVKNQLVY